MFHLRHSISVAVIAAFLAASAFAQPKAPLPAASSTSPGAAANPQIEAKTVDGKLFDLAALKGKVVLVMFWSTSCAVCRDKMPELRGNYEGWAGKPFEVVAISTDTNMQDVLDYERIISSTVPIKQRFIQIWAGQSGYKDNLGQQAALPAAYLLDKEGKVVERYIGRIPAVTWDKIADLL